jgi:hypothetical protein
MQKIFAAALLSMGALGCTKKHSTSTPNIVGGSFVEPHDAIYSTTVSLDANGEPFCTGFLYDMRTVVTAAHCIKGAPKGKVLSIGFGSARTKNKISIPFEPMTHMLAHPQWDSRDMNSSTINPLPTSPKNDLGIVVLPQDAPEWMLPRPVKMIGDVRTGDTVVMAGFGQTQQKGPRGFDSTMELRGEMRRTLGKIETINEHGVEIVQRPFDTESNGSSCHGDSGGPLFFLENDGSVTIIGVTSRAYSKEEDCSGRTVYTDVRKFDVWIRTQRDEVIKKNGPSAEDWQHRYFDATNGTRIALDYQLAPAGFDRTAKTVWVNITNPSFTGSEKVEVEISSYANSLAIHKDLASYAGSQRFTLHLSQIEGQVVCTPHTRWGIQQSLRVSVNNKNIQSGQTKPDEFAFLFCQ